MYIHSLKRGSEQNIKEQEIQKVDINIVHVYMTTDANIARQHSTNFSVPRVIETFLIN